MASQRSLSLAVISHASIQCPEEEQSLLSGNSPLSSRFARKNYVSQWIPEVEPRHPRARTFRTWHSRRDVVLWTATGVSLTVLLINFITTIVFNAKYPPKNDIGTIFFGSRTQATRLSSGIHVLINLLSTLLLGASNMCMQLCVAPTRTELDRAHSKSQWLDIGAPSIKNMRWINRWRVPLVVLLGITSIPLHFLYNSAVFPSIAVNTYEWILVNQNFVDGIPGNFTENFETQKNLYLNYDIVGPPTGQAAPSQRPFVERMTHDWMHQNTSSRKFHQISNLECLQNYTSIFGSRSDLIVVTRNETAMQSNNTLLWMGQWGGEYLDHPTLWICYWLFNPAKTGNLTLLSELSYANCDIFGSLTYFAGNTREEKARNRLELANNWMITNYTVDYCLESRQPTNDLYTVGYSLKIMIAICVANLCKCLGILATAIWYRKHRDPPLSILGDAIASFLERPDFTTRHLGACSIRDIKRREKICSFDGNKHKTWRLSWTKLTQFCSLRRKRRSSTSKPDGSEDETRRWAFPRPPLEWKPETYRWWHGPSKSRWAVALSLCFIVIAVGLGLLIQAISAVASGLSGLTTSQRISYVYNMGFGRPNPSALVKLQGKDALFSSSIAQFFNNVMFANMWQFAISFLYLLVNALVTSMLVSSEWVHYSRHRKPLRVSAPEGIQRSSFFISMPYKYGVPLMGAMAILHWTVSQAVFVVQISSYYSTGKPDTRGSTSAVGYSASGITASIGLGLVILAGIAAIGAKKYDPGMPLASTCSAAISAACHPPDEDYDARFFPVMWGVVERNAKGFVHTSFTTAKDARPLGEADGWRELQEAEDKRAKKEKRRQDRKKAKERRKMYANVNGDKSETLDFRERVKRLGTAEFWRKLFTNLGNWFKRVYEKALCRYSDESEYSDDNTHGNDDDNDNKEIIEIVAPWPKVSQNDL